MGDFKGSLSDEIVAMTDIWQRWPWWIHAVITVLIVGFVVVAVTGAVLL